MGKIPYDRADWVRGHLRGRNLRASLRVDVLHTYAKIHNAGQKAPEAATMKMDQDRTHVGRQMGKHRDNCKYRPALCPYVDVGNLYRL